MKRTFNYTGRRKINRADARFTIHQRERAWAFDAELRLADVPVPAQCRGLGGSSPPEPLDAVVVGYNLRTARSTRSPID